MRYLFGILSVGALLTATFSSIEAMTDDGSQIVQEKEANAAEDNFNKTLDKIGFRLTAPMMWGGCNKDALNRINDAIDKAIIVFEDEEKTAMLNFDVTDYDGLVARLKAHPEIWDDVVSVMTFSRKNAKKRTMKSSAKEACLENFATSVATNAIHECMHKYNK